MRHAGVADAGRRHKGGTMLKEGDKAPAVTGALYDGRTFDVGAPAARTVLFFYPKANTSG
jgi:peroxiredoxin